MFIFQCFDPCATMPRDTAGAIHDRGQVMAKRVETETIGAQTIEQRRLEALIPYARNARTHSEAQVALTAGSIREFGFNNPVLVDGSNGIIAGHGRVLAARKLGLSTVPVIEPAHLSEAQRSGKANVPTAPDRHRRRSAPRSFEKKVAMSVKTLSVANSMSAATGRSQSTSAPNPARTASNAAPRPASIVASPRMDGRASAFALTVPNNSGLHGASWAAVLVALMPPFTRS